MRKVNLNKSFWVKFFSTGFFISFLVPFIPGVYGVILGIGFALLINSFPIILKIIISLVLTVVSIPLCTRAEKIFNQGKDPQNIVIDEVVGVQFASIWFNLFQKLFIFSFNVPLWLLLLLIYGFFDALEPFPIKRIEKLVGGWGIVLDDLMAGVYTIITLYLLLCFLRF
ncbi:MAG: phosphatidylglycerophosphatase A family protein [Minisyncoccia bacterium]